MTIDLSIRVKAIKPSPTLALAAKAKELQAQGKKIIDLTVGEPDFPTPAHIKAAAIKAINDNFTKYTAVDGVPILKKAIINKLSTENKLQYETNQIMVSCGAKHSIYNLLQATIGPGDEVIIPAPYWVSYPDMVLLNDGKPVIIETNDTQKFKITPEQLEQAITPATKAIIINSPSNPTGIAYTADELAELGKVLRRHPQILIISDDIYEHILWNNTPFTNILNACSNLYNQTVIINGVSKAYAMTGWRIGYAAGPAHIITAMKNIQSQSTSCPTSIAQMAAAAALQDDQRCVQEMNSIFKKRHDFLVAKLNTVDGIKTFATDGAFYLFPDVKQAMAKLNCADDNAFAQLLLDQVEIAVVPGSAFGAEGYIRISYATKMESLIEAGLRLKNWLGKNS